MTVRTMRLPKRYPMRRAALALLALVVVAASCSSSTDDGTEWCSSYGDAALAGVAFDSAIVGSPEQVTAAADLEASALALAVAPAPDEIEADIDELKNGPNVADAGDSFSEAAKRVEEWALANCGFSAEIMELFEAEGQ